MNEPVVMGIDGGGSTVRVAIVTGDLTLLSAHTGASANPSAIGPEQATQNVRQAIRAALNAADLPAQQIAAVGIGVAGAAPRHSAAWLRDTLGAVLPKAQIVLSTDYEIALVGAHGQPQGILVLAGTGSLAYGLDGAGNTALVGGWGYLLDDAGSGFWLGQQALQAVVRAADGRASPTDLTPAILEATGVDEVPDLVPWLYHTSHHQVREIARLAPVVLRVAAQDMVAHGIIMRASRELTLAARTVINRLDMSTPLIAFAGGLLRQLNPLSLQLCRELGLPAIPVPKHEPVIGAALLALQHLRQP